MNSPFAGHGLFIDGMVFLSPREALPFLMNGAVLVDLRDGLERNGREFAVPCVRLVPWSDFEAQLPTLPKDTPLILADCVGLMAKQGVRLLQQQGFALVAVLNGGMVGWSNDGMPMVVDSDEQLTGGCACRLRPASASRGRGGC